MPRYTILKGDEQVIATTEISWKSEFQGLIAVEHVSVYVQGKAYLMVIVSIHNLFIQNNHCFSTIHSQETLVATPLKNKQK